MEERKKGTNEGRHGEGRKKRVLEGKMTRESVKRMLVIGGKEEGSKTLLGERKEGRREQTNERRNGEARKERVIEEK